MARRSGPGGGTLCFHPADADGEPMARHAEPGGGGGTCCFHPGDADGEPVARHAEPGGGGGSMCFHPGGEDGASARLADDLAADLHLALTSIDDRQLAMLA
ncbi:hypothetical protein [Micromonospora coxensis]|nr:hypothetical protein [Micromonospora coxensis]